MERHEVDGRCGWSWTSLKSQKNWLPQINLLVQFNLEKNPDLPDVPWRSSAPRTTSSGRCCAS